MMSSYVIVPRPAAHTARPHASQETMTVQPEAPTLTRATDEIARGNERVSRGRMHRVTTCFECGTAVPAAARFCPSCGRQIALPERSDCVVRNERPELITIVGEAVVQRGICLGEHRGEERASEGSGVMPPTRRGHDAAWSTCKARRQRSTSSARRSPAGVRALRTRTRSSATRTSSTCSTGIRRSRRPKRPPRTSSRSGWSIREMKRSPSTKPTSPVGESTSKPSHRASE